MKKAIVQISTAILGIGDNYEEAMEDARSYFSDLTDSDIVSIEEAIAGETVCVDITEELAAYGATDNWDIEDGVAVLVTD
jgi:hypothetical protein